VQIELLDDIERIRPSPTGAASRWMSVVRLPNSGIAGFCRSVNSSEIAEHGHVCDTRRYVGAESGG
jgi:hypothetical protein